MSCRSLISIGLTLLCALPLACSDDGGGDTDAASETDGSGGDGDGDATGDGDGDATDSESDTDTTDTGKDFGDCGNGILDEGEVCDDGNNLTEFPPYAAEDCIDDCSMVLATCNDGVLDEGEDCDDGNDDSKDACTSSCTVNDTGVHAACTVFEEGEEVPPFFNVAEGDIQNCDAVPSTPGGDIGCNRSWEYVGNNLVYAAGGDCQLISLKCDGGDICPAGPIGDYDAMTSCPDGYTLIEKVIDGGGVIPTILSRVCLKSCERDRDCRWNEYDVYWDTPGEYRCSTTPQSNGALVCQDRRNNDL